MNKAWLKTALYAMIEITIYIMTNMAPFHLAFCANIIPQSFIYKGVVKLAWQSRLTEHGSRIAVKRTFGQWHWERNSLQHYPSVGSRLPCCHCYRTVYDVCQWQTTLWTKACSFFYIRSSINIQSYLKPLYIYKMLSMYILSSACD